MQHRLADVTGCHRPAVDRATTRGTGTDRWTRWAHSRTSRSTGDNRSCAAGTRRPHSPSRHRRSRRRRAPPRRRAGHL